MTKEKEVNSFAYANLVNSSGLPSVPNFPGQSRFLNIVPGVPARGEMSRFLEKIDLNGKYDKIALKPLNLKLAILKFPRGIPRDPPLNSLFLKRKW